MLSRGAGHPDPAAAPLGGVPPTYPPPVVPAGDVYSAAAASVYGVSAPAAPAPGPEAEAARSASRTLAIPVAPLTRSQRARAAVVERVVHLKKSSFLMGCISAFAVAVGLTLLRGGTLFGEDGLFAFSSGYSYGLRSAGGGNSTTSSEDGGEMSVPDFANPNRRVRLSRSLANVAGVDEPMKEGDVPFFFHVPRSGGSTLKDIMGMCLGQVVGSDVGTRKGHKYDKELKILEEDGSKFVNVDTTTAEGIHRAKKLGLVESNIADFIATQLLHPAATMFNKNQRGRMFTMIRHPIERAVSLFHYLGVADWEPTYDPDLAYISIEMYARSKRVEFNWMVRFLSNELERDLTPKHLEVAKEVLRTKALIGLLTEKGESFARFERYFGWTYADRGAKECQDRLLHWGWSNKHAHPTVEEGSPAWEELWKKNALDMELFEYAKTLFDEQASMFREGGTFGPEKAAPPPQPEEGGQGQQQAPDQAQGGEAAPAEKGQPRQQRQESRSVATAAADAANGASNAATMMPSLQMGDSKQQQMPSSPSRSLAWGGSGDASAGQVQPRFAGQAQAQPQVDGQVGQPQAVYGSPMQRQQQQQPIQQQQQHQGYYVPQQVPPAGAAVAAAPGQ